MWTIGRDSCSSSSSSGEAGIVGLWGGTDV